MSNRAFARTAEGAWNTVTTDPLKKDALIIHAVEEHRRRGAAAKRDAVIRSVLRNRRIIVVEDDFFFALDPETELQAAQAIVLGPAGRVQAALDIITSDSEIAAAILDVNIGGEIVFPVADALLQRQVPFVFATGESREAIPTSFAGIRIYPKPSSSSDIVQGVANLLAV